MSAEFVDTNIFIYAHDSSAGQKRDKARALIARLFEDGDGAISTQVLSEFYSIATKKLSMNSQVAEAIVSDLRVWTLHRATHADIIAAIQLQRRYAISWWDALIVNSAIELGCRVLWSEDLSHGQQYGPITLRNPFA
jgi:predicted nucleic acid-binding protein